MIDRRDRTPSSPATDPSHDSSRAERGALVDALRECSRVAVALSGGVDSGLLLAVARDVLGERAVGVTGVSPSLSVEELRVARAVAAHLDAPLLEISTDELSRPDYVANRGDRCFHCKTELYGLLATHPRLAGHTLVDGSHADDAAGDRPGMRAARDHAVRSPLREAGLGKEAIRAWAHELGLPNWDRPARPCLASRIAVGSRVTAARLAVVGELERFLAEEGFRVYRARLVPGAVVLELGRDELDRLSAGDWRDRFVARAHALGERAVLADTTGYRAPGEVPVPRAWVDLSSGLPVDALPLDDRADGDRAGPGLPGSP